MTGSSTALGRAERVARCQQRSGRLAQLLLAVAWALFGCGEHGARQTASENRPQEHGDARGAGSESTRPNSASDGAASAGGRGAEGGAAGAAGDAREAERQVPRLVCPGRERRSECRIGGDARAGLRLVGTLLEPAAERVGGVVDVAADGTLRCVGCDCGDPGQALVIDCPELLISPGFVNLHDHLSYAGTPPLSHPGELYQHRSDWRLGEHGHAPLAFEGGASAAQVLAHELRMLMSGVTSTVGAGGRRGLLRNLELAGASEGVWPARILAETFPLDDARAAADSAACKFGPRPDRSAQVASAQAYLPHLGEGTDQRARDELDCALGELELVGAHSAVIHAMALTRGAAAELAARGASVIWSPRSNLDLYGSTAPVALLASQGVHVALGSDWLASGSMNLLRELDCAADYDAQVLGGYFGAYERWRMVTENPAWALGLETRLGALRPGAVADLALFRASAGQSAYASVVAARAEDVLLVLRGGRAIYGDAALISAFGSDCSELDVCGAARSVCLDTGNVDWAELRAAGEAVYPLFSCEQPPNEPTCRALAQRECPAGELECEPPPALPPALERDADGDGVADALDLCPRAFDPAQEDSDGDGLGDACDACASANPGLSPCPSSVARLRAPGTRLALGTAVELRELRVTGVRQQGAKGFYVEDGDHADYSGIFVYTAGKAPGVSLFDVVGVRGYFQLYRGTDELVDVEVFERRAGAEPYPPRSVELAQLADGSPLAQALASLFVEARELEVQSTNPDAPQDYDETGLKGGLRLDDLLLPALDNTYAVSDHFAVIQGISGFSYGHQKLWPLQAPSVERASP